MTDPVLPPASPLSQAQLASALLRLADALAWPLMLMDAHGALRHANLAARQSLADCQPLRQLAHQRVSPAAESLRPAFAAALQAAAAGQPQGLAWPTPAGEIQGRLHPLPQVAGTEALLMLVLAVNGQPGPDLRGYARACHLSAPQRRVLQALVRAGSADGFADWAAANLGLAPSTVRRHINALCRKTGHASVAELLMTVGRLPPSMHVALSLSQTLSQTIAPQGDGEGQ